MPNTIQVSDYEYIISHFDGNNNDMDDVAGVPIAAALTNAAGVEDKSFFFYNNNLSEFSNENHEKRMRESAAFAEKLGIETFDYQANLSATTNKLVSIFNSGEKVLSIEGGPMEAVYRALAQVNKSNLKNITLLSHSSWNEDRNVGTRPGGGKPRTWKDLKRDFSDITFIDIRDQNDGVNNDRGFFSHRWGWLDNTNDSVLKEARQLMKNANGKVNDPSDAGMHFFAFTGNDNGNPIDAQKFFNANPPEFVSSSAPTNPKDENPSTSTPPTTDNVYQAKNGQVIIEAENTQLQGDWEKVTIDGRQAILYDGKNSFGKVPVGQTLEYSFQTDESGNYKIALHSARHKAVMQEYRNDLGNDAWIEIIDSQTNKTMLNSTKLFTGFGGSNNEYRWGTKFDANKKHFDAAVNLSANKEYTLRVSGRSDGYVIDRITLSNDGFLRNASAPESSFLQGSPSKPTEYPVSPPEKPVLESGPIRINAGGKAYTDQAGNVWSADKFFVGGKTYQTKSAIAKTSDDPLYQSERWQQNLSYNFPVENGDYQVTLKFAEIYWNKSGARIFDTFAEGKIIVDNLDLIPQAGGKNIAFDQTFMVSVNDGNLDLDLTASLNNAKIAAIEILPTSDTDPQPQPEPQPDPGTTVSTIYGTKRDDVVVGTQGDDRIYGTNGKSNGQGDIDTLTGGQGADTFVLGEKDKVYFDDLKGDTIGKGDYAMITDFNLEEGDSIQLGREPDNYRLGSMNDFDGQAIFLKTQGQDELIAMVANETNLNLDSEAFIFA